MQSSDLVREGRASAGCIGVMTHRRYLPKRGGEKKGGERILGKKSCMVVGGEHEEHKGLKEMGIRGGTGLAGKVSRGCAVWACRALLRNSALT